MTVDKSEVLRYLGYRGQQIDESLRRLLDECIGRCEEIARPKWVYAGFDLSPGGASLLGTSLSLPGESIREYLDGCESVMLMAATLGIGADRELRLLQSRDMTRSLVADACFTALIEAACDDIEDEIRQIAGERGLAIKYRYSPGYGDLPLQIQPDFLAVLDAGRKIGLTCTDSLIMMPSKSVTALIGLTRREQRQAPDPCANCAAREGCKFRKEGEFCGRRVFGTAE